MKKISSFEEFETLIKNEPVPDFDKEHFVRSINEKIICTNRNRRIKLCVILPVTVISVLLMSSIAYSDEIFSPITKTFDTVYSMIIKDLHGNASFEYVKVKNEEVPNEKRAEAIYQQFGAVMYEHKSVLKKDEVEVFVVTKAYDINKAVQILKSEPYFSNLEDLIKSTDTEFMITPSCLSFRISNTIPMLVPFSNNRSGFLL